MLPCAAMVLIYLRILLGPELLSELLNLPGVSFDSSSIHLGLAQSADG